MWGQAELIHRIVDQHLLQENSACPDFVDSDVVQYNQMSEALNLAAKPSMTVVQVERDLGITPGLICK